MSDREHPGALVVGGGPAGLMAAETLAAAGISVLVAEAKPTLGRKLLMAGKSGLNLTKAGSAEAFATAYTAGGSWLRPILVDFGPEAVVAWAEGLGIATSDSHPPRSAAPCAASAARWAAAAAARRRRRRRQCTS